MNILAALKQEEKQLQQELNGIQGAIAALSGRHEAIVGTGLGFRRTLSASARAKISKAATERWAKVRADKAKRIGKSK